MHLKQVHHVTLSCLSLVITYVRHSLMLSHLHADWHVFAWHTYNYYNLQLKGHPHILTVVSAITTTDVFTPCNSYRKASMPVGFWYAYLSCAASLPIVWSLRSGVGFV